LVFVGAIAPCALAADLYVAPNGSDANAGTSDRPLATLQGARDALRGKPTHTEPTTIHIRGGDYRLTQSFELGEHDSGTRDAPVVYRADGQTPVRISGGALVPPAAVRAVTDQSILARLPESSRGKVVQVDLKALGINEYGQIGPRGFGRRVIPAPLELFINDQPMTLSRWPNADEPPAPLGKVIDAGSVPRSARTPDRGGIIAFDIDKPLRWSAATDVWISGLFHNGYADDIVRVAKIDPTAKTMTTAQPHTYGFHSGKPFNAWVALNLLGEIDRPGEYCIDRTSATLYVLPPGPIENARMELSVLDAPLVSLKSASFVTLEGLTIECGRGCGVYVEGGEGNRITHCTVRNLGTVGVSVGKDLTTRGEPARDHDGYVSPPITPLVGPEAALEYDSTFDRVAGHNQQIESCEIYNTGGGGVSLGGGDRKTLAPGGNAVVDCNIHDVKRWCRTYKPGVYIDGVGNRIAHCHIYNCTTSAIYLHGNDHLIELNEIDHAETFGEDMGVFYMGRNPSEQGNELRNNFFHHCGHAGDVTYVLHLDDMTCGTRVVGNIVYACDCATNVNGGYENAFINNIFIDNRNSSAAHAGIRSGWDVKRALVYLHTPPLQRRIKTEVDITQPPYSTRYPRLKWLYEAPPEEHRCNQVWRNVSVRSGTLGSPRPEENPPGNDMRDNFETSEDPGFANAAGMDFTLKHDSEIFRRVPGFEVIPFGSIGRTTHANPAQP
jgi:hypothetical protein